MVIARLPVASPPRTPVPLACCARVLNRCCCCHCAAGAHGSHPAGAGRGRDQGVQLPSPGKLGGRMGAVGCTRDAAMECVGCNLSSQCKHLVVARASPPLRSTPSQPAWWRGASKSCGWVPLLPSCPSAHACVQGRPCVCAYVRVLELRVPLSRPHMCAPSPRPSGCRAGEPAAGVRAAVQRQHAAAAQAGGPGAAAARGGHLQAAGEFGSCNLFRKGASWLLLMAWHARLQCTTPG